MKIGLVLGGGGFVGGAWLTGALQALEDATGLLPSRFDRVVGTSAGAMIASLTTSGVSPTDVPSLFAGEGGASRPSGARVRLERALPLPGSLRLAWSALRNPRRHPVGVAAAALLPRGVVSTEPLREMVREVVPEGWSGHEGLWLMACELDTGLRVAFGREGAPAAELADAVAASCAIPGFYCPVRIEGAAYVDGGCCSPSNLDVLRREALDHVVCFNPTSSVAPTGGLGLRERIGELYRAPSRARLELEAAKLQAAGTEVLLVQPTPGDLEVMGNNLMASANLATVTEVARSTVGAELAKPAAKATMRALSRAARPSRPRRKPAVRDRVAA